MEMSSLCRCRVLKRVPKASRIPAADKLADILRKVVVDPDSVDKWVDLLSFSFTGFGVPGQRGGRRHRNSLASKVNAAITCLPSLAVPVQRQQPYKSRQSSHVNLAARVSSKLEDSDNRGAIRLAASDDTLAPFDDVTAEALLSKYPFRTSPSSPPSTTNTACLFLQQFYILRQSSPSCLD